jgi:hypothetical protein
MAASETQYDYNPGLDLTAEASITPAELHQSIAQIAPLINIGGVILLDGDGGNNWPGTVNNPRFLRYVWIDTDTSPPSVKIHDQAGDTYNDWISIGLSASSIIQAYLAVDAVSVYDTDGTTKKISLKGGVADLSKAGYIARLDAAGNNLELVALATILSAGSVPITGLAGGTDNQFARMSGSTAGWETVNFADELAAESVSLSKMAGDSNAHRIIKQNSAGTGQETASIDTIISTLLSNNTISLNQLAGSSASTGQVPRWNGSNWVPATQALAVDGATDVLSTTGDDSNEGTPDLSTAVHTFNHSFAAVPKLVRAVCVCLDADQSYVAGDEVDISAFGYVNSVNSDGHAVITVAADSTSIKVIVRANNNIGIVPKDGSAISNIDRTKWRPKIYAWK